MKDPEKRVFLQELIKDSRACSVVLLLYFETGKNEENPVMMSGGN